MSKRHPRVRRLLAVAAAAAAMLATLTIQAGTATADQPNSVTQGGQQSGQRSTTPKIGHVWTIILENKSYEATFTGLNNNSYLWKTLPSYGELLRQY